MKKAAWMSGKYGIMVHFLANSQPKNGNCKLSPNQMADNFNVRKFVSEAKSMGAHWIIFPFGQNEGWYWSYNSVIEKYHPGSCSKRDLALEIAIETKNQGMRFIGYFPTELDDNISTMRSAFGWDLSPDKKIFMERWTEVVAYYSDKFGSLMDGWWFDGNYDSSLKKFKRTHDWDNSRFQEEQWFLAARKGNPNRITAMCNGANDMKYVFEQEEYLPGESIGPDKTWIEKYNNGDDSNFYPWDYASNPKQWHTLIWLDCFWAHTEHPGEILPPKFSDNVLFPYAKTCLNQKGAITWNIGIYEDSSLAEDTVAQIHRLNDFLHN